MKATAKRGKHRMEWGRRVKSAGGGSGAKHKRKVWYEAPKQSPKVEA